MPARCQGAFQTGYRRRLRSHADRHLRMGEAGRLAFSRAALQGAGPGRSVIASWSTVAREWRYFMDHQRALRDA